MRQFILIVFSLLFLISCNKKYPSNLDYDYFSNNTMDFESAKKIEKEEKYVYVFSKRCGHCQNIKERILKFAYNHSDIFFFVEYSKEIKVCDNNDDVASCVKGTPTLFHFYNKSIIEYVGQNEIINYIKMRSNYI